MEAEEAVAALEQKLNDPDFQTTHFAEVPRVVSDLDAARQTATSLFERWEELEALRDL